MSNQHNPISLSCRLAGPATACLLAAVSPAAAQVGGQGDDPYANLPTTLSITGVVRDFRAIDEPDGHPDFQVTPYVGSGLFYGIAADALDDGGKPVFNSTGYKQAGAWKDAQGRPIIAPKNYVSAEPGDTNGSMSQNPGGAVASAESFAQWFRDVPGVNSSKSVSIMLNRAPLTNIYTFDDTIDPDYNALGGFFPVNGELFGNYKATSKNYHFTFEMETKFTYKEGTGQVFTFSGDDAIWVYVDSKLVIDLGGVHSKLAQTIDLDRLEWLEDGKSYTLKLFFAERHTTQSNFRIDTTIPLMNVNLQPAAALFD